MYTLLMLVTSTTILAYLKAKHSNRWGWWLLFASAGLLSIYTHLFAIFVLVAIGIDALIDRRKKQALIRTVVIGVILLLLFLPWITLVAGESQHGLGSLRPLARQPDAQLWPLKLLTSLTFLIFGYATNVWYVAVAWFLLLSTLIIGLFELNKARRQGNVSALRLPLLVIVCSVGIPVTIYAFRPFFLPERTLAVASPFLAIFLAWCTTRRGSTLPFQVAAITIFMIIGTAIYLSQSAQKPPYRDVARFLQEQTQDGDVILHTSDGSYLPVLCYLSYEPHGLLAGDPDPRKPVHVYEALGGEVWSREESIQLGNRLWLVVAREHSIAWQNKQADYFLEHYPQLAAYDFSGISVALYDLKGSTIAFSP
jgi:hypothetical protein